MVSEKKRRANKNKVANTQKIWVVNMCNIIDKKSKQTIISIELKLKSATDNITKYEKNVKWAWMILMHRLIDDKALGLNDKYLNDFRTILLQAERVEEVIKKSKGKILEDFWKDFILEIKKTNKWSE